MKKFRILFTLILFLSVSAVAQKQTTRAPVSVPIDSATKLITYEAVIEAPGVKADVLYRKALSWFNSYYKNPSEVIRDNDSLKFKIVGKPRLRLSNPPGKDGTKTDGGLVQYTITIAAKDGRFKYELTSFNWKQTSYYACERWLDTKSTSYSPVYADYMVQVDDYVKELIKNLKTALLTDKTVKDKDKW